MCHASRGGFSGQGAGPLHCFSLCINTCPLLPRLTEPGSLLYLQSDKPSLM